ncbi:MAG: winged helix-turn-helix transcriptional regulator [Anaerolineaceae bacterium]|jgi:DNA-binding MarR family transcriptional regulator|nr:MAG: winged helix-turn-helix transcriptional regulator [Anaerolineaceae bacterium]
MKNLQNHENRDLDILEHIENDPETTQATIAARLGVAVGTVNWHLKRLIEKGYVKVRRVERRKLRYIITPQGIAHRANLLVDYIQTSFDMYRLVRQRSLDAIQKIKTQGYTKIFLEGSGDVAEICRLTCLEQGLQIVEEKGAPIFRIEGLKIFIIMEDSEHGYE